ncbi:aminotransferase class I and II [Brevibacillus brevis]|nr:aminotransferase class I and II [Brevibacillus brevis]GEC88692.1 hypothetical protein BBR01nite_10230 [Brevibacillus brevis]VEF86892.1 HTH-type transcriptional regulator norG [Brevibacillus brevis]
MCKVVIIIWKLEDDPFSLTSYDGKPPLPLKSLDQLGSVVYIGSFSKIAASGLRVGWMVAPHSVVERLADARQQMDFGLSVVPQKIAAQFLHSDNFLPHLERLRMHLQYRRDLLVEAVVGGSPATCFPVACILSTFGRSPSKLLLTTAN